DGRACPDRASVSPARPSSRTATRDRPRQGAASGRHARGRGNHPKTRAAQVKLTDVNLLLYAVDTSAPRHRAARRWLEERLSETETFAFSWAVLLAFLRLSTNPRVFEAPLAPSAAFDIVDGWLGHPCSTVVHPTER